MRGRIAGGDSASTYLCYTSPYRQVRTVPHGMRQVNDMSIYEIIRISQALRWPDTF